MAEGFETMLSGGHPNSLGRTLEVVDIVLNNRERHLDLYKCYFSNDELVRLRVSNAMRRVTVEHPGWTMDFMDGLQDDVAAIDQASTQWTLAILFDLTKHLLTDKQIQRAVEIMRKNVAEHCDWIVLNNSMMVLSDWSEDDVEAQGWLRPHLERHAKDNRKSVAGRAKKYLARMS